MWPLSSLRLTTPDLELRLPTEDELEALAARDDILSSDDPPYLGPWTQLRGEGFAISTLQHHWRSRALWTPSAWGLNLAVFERSTSSASSPSSLPIGSMSLHSKEWLKSREVGTGSWIYREHRGRGLGKQMRTAVLTLAFRELGARTARSSALPSNEASLGVSRALGYREDGTAWEVIDPATLANGELSPGAAREVSRVRLDRDEFRPACEVEITGLERAWAMFGLSGRADPG